MRRVLYAESFVDDADKIAADIEARLGVRRAATFRDEFDWYCTVVSSNPRIGKTDNGDDATLYGVPHGANWIFFQFDDDEARFIHIVSSKRDKPAIRF